ncbi:phage terminase large subunit [Burkholderia stagnalis]|uniref:phage terminase large subunit n=1 Tax=Burkholderia stagnalis TaxID=1503054 RepID=UPI000753557F|nr:phage terminase large subunit [Burkholderia stagnalis]KVC52312.1 transcriptional regulator [Burkholderia stagnalis]KVN17493.1 transcriptional regulator [Burkholderia stagnalis]KWI73601.1 transcriptional regulator [Burkholderia stagnalis]KWK63317.1 transcriptional regulator [Burkholderia stagnalis]KWN17583.1 transcriptional regulator [Burkholderia stagnalis]
MRKKVSFLAFFLMWADRMRWEVPDIHVRAVIWMEHRGDLAVLRCFRGFSKSTILAIYNAWRYHDDPTYRILHQSESDPTAYKTSRDTKNVLRNHPLTRDLLPPGRGTVEQWWCIGAMDERNASMYAKGILSNVTSARADEAQNDDVEVPRNIQTPEAREKLRYRLGEQTHILVPGGRTLYIGTPHTHDSLYDEIEAMGADCLTIRMFEREYRIDRAKTKTAAVPFKPEYVFVGIGKDARLLEEGRDYRYSRGKTTFTTAPDALVDCYVGCAWPERFDRAELLKRRQRTRTINEWDSQYQLHSKPIHDSRLDPEHIKAYDVHPRVESANRGIRMMLGNVQIVSGRAYWDPSKGKIGGDASAFSLMLDDGYGNHYWHVAEPLTGELAEFSDERNTKIIGGQVMQLAALVRRFNIVQVCVETNGIGAFVPTVLKRALQQETLRCAVKEVMQSSNKNERILAGLESPLASGVLWAHVDVLDGPLWDQMKDWNPVLRSQPDDYLDSGAGAILQAPIRINHLVGKPTADVGKDWRQSAGVYDVTFEN